MFTKFYRQAYADVKSGHVDITKELERAKKSIKIASRCGFVYSGLSCVTCCLCFVKPCCLIAFDENDRYKTLKRTLAKCEAVYGKDWHNSRLMNDLFIRVMDVIEATIIQIQSKVHYLQDTKRRMTTEYENNPTNIKLLEQINDITSEINQIIFMGIDDNECVRNLMKHVVRHHNPNTDMLASNFPIAISQYDMTLLRASIPIMTMAFGKRYLLRMDDIIAIDTRAAYALLSI